MECDSRRLVRASVPRQLPEEPLTRIPYEIIAMAGEQDPQVVVRQLENVQVLGRMIGVDDTLPVGDAAFAGR